MSAGYVCAEPRAEFFRHMNAANIDLKAFTEGFYKGLCSARLAPALETLEYLKRETGVWFEITTLLIPGENDSEAEVEALSRWVAERLGPDVPLTSPPSRTGRCGTRRRRRSRVSENVQAGVRRLIMSRIAARSTIASDDRARYS